MVSTLIQNAGEIQCAARETSHGRPAHMIGVLKVTPPFLPRISSKSCSYGKVDETTATSLKNRKRKKKTREVCTACNGAIER